MKDCMIRLLSIVFIVLVTSIIISAEETTCPANRVELEGHNPFSEFHEVMAPAWHVAWVEKDYDALFEAGPKFESIFKSIASLEPSLKTEALNIKFNEHRNKFAEIVTEYAKACKAKDSALVYSLIPDLHDWFEMTASVLLPVYFEPSEKR